MTTRKEQAAASRAHLVDTALRLFVDQGYEATISERMNRRAAAREAAREAGRTPKNPFPAPEVPRGAGASINRRREENRKKLAETEKRDAST